MVADRNQEEVFKLEEAFDTQRKRESRKERRRLTEKDRSQFKKSDRDQRKKLQTTPPPPTDHLIQGDVIAILSDGIMVRADAATFRCSLRGALKQLRKQNKNLVAVGDHVYFEQLGHSEGAISHIGPRHSLLARADHLSQNRQQLIAVNVDQVLITTSIHSPPLKPPLIDRYLIAAGKGNLKAIILINKIDCLPKLSAVERALYEETLSCYRTLNISILPLSIKTGEGLDLLKRFMEGKISVLSGQSGTGKSSLLNAVANTHLPVGSVVERTRKGSHTTTTTEMLPLPFGGFCIDTPGVQSFGLWELSKQDIFSYFPEITSLQTRCRYANCSHLEEAGCVAEQASEEGLISYLRFASYRSLMSSLSQAHHPR